MRESPFNDSGNPPHPPPLHSQDSAPMAYPAYETVPPLHRSMSYGQQYAGYPPGVAYSQPVGVYDQNYQQPGAYPYTPGGVARSMSQYAYDDMNLRGGGSYFPETYATSGYATPYAPRELTRRRSSMSRRGYERHRGMSTSLIKFKRKGGFRSGITLGEAMSSVMLSGNDSYSHYDFNADHRGKIVLKLRWTGYTSMTYELPVDNYDGRVELQTLARRIARACVHFIQTNMIPVSWDRVVLYHLEEISIGTWQPVLSTS